MKIKTFNIDFKVFNKYLITTFILLLLFASGIKLYSILTEPNISDRNYHQLQKIDKSKNNFSFAVFWDNKNSTEVFNNLISKLNKENILFTIDNGDLVYDGENAKFSFFFNQIKYLNKPLLTVFGNHEAKDKGRVAYYNLFGPFYYSFTVGNNYFIILDDANEKRLDDEQYVWLKNELKKSQKYKNRFVFMHVPLYDPRKGNYKKGHSLKDLKFVKKLNKLFDENNVTMLFVSHIHAYFQGIWWKTPYIISGWAGVDLAGTDSKSSKTKHYFYHYIKVTIDKNWVHYKVIKLNSSFFEPLDRIINDIWVYIYAFFASNFIEALLILSLLYLSIYVISLKWNWIINKLNNHLWK